MELQAGRRMVSTWLSRQTELGAMKFTLPISTAKLSCKHRWLGRMPANLSGNRKVTCPLIQNTKTPERLWRSGVFVFRFCTGVRRLCLPKLAPDKLQILCRRGSPIFGVGTERQAIICPGGDHIRSAGNDGAIAPAVRAVSREYIRL